MKFKEKLLIFIAAVILSVLGFNLIASSSVCLLKIAKESGLESIEKYRARCDVDVYRIQRINVKISPIALLSPEYCQSK